LIEDAPLQMALEGLAQADILRVQGLQPDSDYRFKHTLMQDAAYENLLKSRRQLLHRRTAEALRDNAGPVAVEPELLAHHFTQAGLTETAIEWWGKAGQRSLERSTLAEAVEQFTRAIAQIAHLACHRRAASRRDRTSGRAQRHSYMSRYAAPEPMVAAERARLLIEQAEALGEPPEDPLLVFSVLYSVWVANRTAFNGDVMRNLGAQFLALADKQGTMVPLMIGHRIMGISLLLTGKHRARPRAA
jgi:hypothetical protein